MILFIHPLADELAQKLEDELGEKVIVRESVSDARSDLKDAEILVGSRKILTEEVIELCHKLKWLHVSTAGIDRLPFTKLNEKSILVTNSRGIHALQIAEQCIGVMISFTRNLHFYIRNQTDSNWRTEFHLLDELYGKKLCIIGAGQIGREVARKAKAFEMQVIGIKRNQEPVEYFDEIIETKQMYEALRKSDFVLTLIPSTPQTHHFFGKKEFDAMPKNSVFLNYSRGEVVDEDAMINVLREGKIKGAGLDVFMQEPLPSDSPLWKMPNVIITPHNAGTSKFLNERLTKLFIENYFAYKQGLKMPTAVDLQLQY